MSAVTWSDAALVLLTMFPPARVSGTTLLVSDDEVAPELGAYTAECGRPVQFGSAKTMSDGDAAPSHGHDLIAVFLSAGTRGEHEELLEVLTTLLGPRGALVLFGADASGSARDVQISLGEPSHAFVLQETRALVAVPAQSGTSEGLDPSGRTLVSLGATGLFVSGGEALSVESDPARPHVTCAVWGQSHGGTTITPLAPALLGRATVVAVAHAAEGPVAAARRPVDGLSIQGLEAERELLVRELQVRGALIDRLMSDGRSLETRLDRPRWTLRRIVRSGLRRQRARTHSPGTA